MTSIKTALRLAGVLSALAIAPMVQAQPEIIDQIAAIVDDDVVMLSELQERETQVQSGMRAQGRPMPPMKELRQQILNQMVVENLQLQMARRAGVRISDARLNQAVASIAAQNNMTLDQFRESLEAQGMSYVATREQIRREMLVQQVQAGNINNRIDVTQQEIENFLNSTEGQQMTAPQYRVAHIIIPLETIDPGHEQKQRALLEQASLEINAGMPLQAWLQRHNTDKNIPLQGGDIGWRQPSDLPGIFADVVPKLAAGEASQPFRSAGGLHLVQVVDKRGGVKMVDQTHSRHILVKPSEIRSDDQCEALLIEVRQRIINGEPFGDMARQYTEDIASAQEGGDLGWAAKGKFVPAFEATLDTLQPGQMSQPFRSQFGWHLLEVLERRKHDVGPEIAKNQAYRFLFERKFNEELEAWLQKIRDEAYVDIKV